MNMLLAVALTLHIVLAAFSHASMKLATDSLPKAKSITWMFVAASLASLLYGLITHQSDFLMMNAVFIVGAGIVNSYGTFCQWQAYKHSLGRTSIFLPVGQVVAALLAALFLGEALLYRSGWFFLAAALLFASAALLSWRKTADSRDTTDHAWLGWTVGMVAIFGGAIFLQKVFSASVGAPAFLTFWYAGGAIGSLFLIGLEKDSRPVPLRQSWKIGLASLGILGALATLYWAFQLAPAGVVLPIKSFGTTVLVILLGWTVFKERAQLTPLKVVGFILGILGLLVLSLSRI